MIINTGHQNFNEFYYDMTVYNVQCLKILSDPVSECCASLQSKTHYWILVFWECGFNFLMKFKNTNKKEVLSVVQMFLNQIIKTSAHQNTTLT
jgi:hypothetical protein